MSATENANQIKEEASIVADRAENIVVIITADQKSAEKKLQAAKPALESAEAALLVNYIIEIFSTFDYFHLNILDYQSFRYSNCTKVGQAAISHYCHYGCCTYLFQEKG